MAAAKRSDGGYRRRTVAHITTDDNRLAVIVPVNEAAKEEAKSLTKPHGIAATTEIEGELRDLAHLNLDVKNCVWDQNDGKSQTLQYGIISSSSLTTQLNETLKAHSSEGKYATSPAITHKYMFGISETFGHIVLILRNIEGWSIKYRYTIPKEATMGIGRVNRVNLKHMQSESKRLLTVAMEAVAEYKDPVSTELADKSANAFTI
jgi:hypothetical protein